MNRVSKFIIESVTRYKQRRVAAVVDAFVNNTMVWCAKTIPAVVSMYGLTAKTIVAKTYENPQPAAQLAAAFDECVKHYGPELKTIWNEFDAHIDGIQESAQVKDAFNRLMTTIKELDDAPLKS